MDNLDVLVVDELEELAEPICDWLGKYGTSNTQIVIDREGARIIENI
ncbi:MAG: hypothetical protein UD936_01955 [Acutalibacteraceae bacterium]|nr:hypothetical protein [Acutalibacteraceae bacterium]